MKPAPCCRNPVMVSAQIPRRDRLKPRFQICRDKGVLPMLRLKALLIAAPIAAALLAAPAAHAEWRGHGGGGWHGGGGGWHGGGYRHDRGPGVAGAILGLGAAAVIGGVIASQAYAPPPPVYYAPPPVYYAPPQTYYAPPQAYYAPPPPYYAPPAPYYPRY
jgi:hypothetical protein